MMIDKDALPSLPTPRLQGSPQSLEEIMTLAFSLTQSLVIRFRVPVLLLIVLAGIEGFFPNMLVLTSILKGIIQIYLFIAVVRVGLAPWRHSSISTYSPGALFPWRSFFRLIGLQVWIALIGGLGLLLLIIPGLVYLVNRSLAAYPVLAHDTKVFDALRESKLLMTSGPWYHWRGPWARLGALWFILTVIGIFFAVMGGGITFLAHQLNITAFTAVTAALIQGVGVLFSTYSIACNLSFYADLVLRWQEAVLRQQQRQQSPL